MIHIIFNMHIEHSFYIICTVYSVNACCDLLFIAKMCLTRSDRSKPKSDIDRVNLARNNDKH